MLDTNIVIALVADEAIVKNNLGQANEVFIPSFVIGELCYGARKSGRVQANLARVDEVAANSTVLGCDAETAKKYGEVKNKLRLKGRPLPENDVWIAALHLFQLKLKATPRLNLSPHPQLSPNPGRGEQASDSPSPNFGRRG